MINIDDFTNTPFVLLSVSFLIFLNIYFILNWLRELLIVHKKSILERRSLPRFIRRLLLCIATRPIQWKLMFTKSVYNEEDESEAGSQRSLDFDILNAYEQGLKAKRESIVKDEEEVKEEAKLNET